MNGDQTENDCFSPVSMPSGAVGMNARQSSNRKDENSLVVIGHEDDDARDNRDSDLQNNDPEGGYYSATPMNDAVYHCKRTKSGIVISSPITANDENENKYEEQYQFEATDDEEATLMSDAVYRCKRSKSRIVISSTTANDENENKNKYEEQYRFEVADEEATPMNDAVYRCKRSKAGIVISTPTANVENANKSKEQYQFEATDEEISCTDDASFGHKNKPSRMRSTIDANDNNFDDDKSPVTTKYMGIASVLTVAICILISTLIYLVNK